MNIPKIQKLLLFILLLCSTGSYAQEQYVRDLEQTIYRLNNEFNYTQSITINRNFISNAKNNDERYYGYLFLSYTYRRLFENEVALRYLDTALLYGLNTQHAAYYFKNVTCQKAMTYFNQQHYAQSDSLMKVLARNQYQDLNESDLAKIFVQEGVLLLQDKKYQQASARFNAAIEKVKWMQPCDLPLIYGNQIPLYAATHELTKMDSAFRLAIQSADDCGVAKSKLFAHEMMVQAYSTMGDYKKAFYYLRKLEALNKGYDRNTNLEQITMLDKRFQTKEKETKLLLQGKQIQRKNLFISILLGSLAFTMALVLLGFVVRRNRQQQREEILRVQFTRQLLQNTELERSRIAGELHDGISHDLLILKNAVQADPGAIAGKIDRIINDIRQISRNLHPIMLDKIGLKASLEHLCDEYMQDEQLFVTSAIDYEKLLSPQSELQLYRVVQEALTNIRKYANAHAARISIGPLNRTLMVTIEDNGKGFDVATKMAASTAFGLHSMIERSKAMGGKANISSGAFGTTIQIEIPLRHA